MPEFVPWNSEMVPRSESALPEDETDEDEEDEEDEDEEDEEDVEPAALDEDVLEDDEDDEEEEEDDDFLVLAGADEEDVEVLPEASWTATAETELLLAEEELQVPLLLFLSLEWCRLCISGVLGTSFLERRWRC